MGTRVVMPALCETYKLQVAMSLPNRTADPTVSYNPPDGRVKGTGRIVYT
jgi:hypothetical protein